ncbi:MAG: PIN domain-containing protein [Gammaproteobacteria bacterium]
MLMLDTNTISYYFRGAPSVVTRMLATPPDRIAVSAVVVYELRTGLLRMPAAAGRKRMEALDSFLASIETLSFDRAASHAAAVIAASLAQRGEPIGPLDVLIAGAARAVGATLVTRNVREFARVDGLLIENWFGEG